MRLLPARYPLITGVLLIVVAACGATFGRWASERQLPIQVLKVRVLTPVVKPDEELRVEFTIQRFRTDCAIVVTRLLLDSERGRYVLMPREFPSAPGPLGTDSYVVPVAIPKGIALGPATYRTLTSYACNALHYVWPLVAPQIDVTFEVKP